jgi:hypothetical protein
MKRTVALTILGVAAATAAFGQGHILIGNYVGPNYNNVTWDSSVATVGGNAVTAADGLQFQVWFGAGVISDDSLLQAGATTEINPAFTYKGGGYYSLVEQVLPSWQPGDTYTFQVRVMPGTTPNGEIDTLLSRSVLWQETSVPGGRIDTTGNPARVNENGVGFSTFVVAVPEPSTFALAGLGAAAMLIFRRRS